MSAVIHEQQQAMYATQPRPQQGRLIGNPETCVKQRPFQEAGIRLNQEIQALDSELSILIEKLAPVIVPQDAMGCGQTGSPTPPQSPLVAALQAASDNIYRLRSRVQAATAALDL